MGVLLLSLGVTVWCDEPTNNNLIEAWLEHNAQTAGQGEND
jgi:hypothetical protein